MLHHHLTGASRDASETLRRAAAALYHAWVGAAGPPADDALGEVEPECTCDERCPLHSAEEH